jgi:hypothetical protein
VCYSRRNSQLRISHFIFSFDQDQNSENYTTPLKTQSVDDSIQRRQSLSARYLMKTTSVSSEVLTPVAQIDEENSQSSPSPSPTIPDKPVRKSLPASIQPSLSSSNFLLNQNQFASEFFKIRKNKGLSHLQASLHFQHTESSLNKIRAKQQEALETLENGDLISETAQRPLSSVKASPIKSSLLEASESTLNNLKRTASLLGLNNIEQQQHIHLPSSISFNNANCIETNGLDSQHSMSNSTCLPPKANKQVKSVPTNRLTQSQPQSHKVRTLKSTNIETSSELQPTTTRIRKLSNSIQNLQLTKSPSNDLKLAPNSRRLNSASTKKPLKYRRSNTDEVNTLADQKTNSNDRNSQSPALEYTDFDYGSYFLKYNKSLKLFEQLHKQTAEQFKKVSQAIKTSGDFGRIFQIFLFKGRHHGIHF